MAQQFNDTASPNGPVASKGNTKEGATPPSPPRATGRPQGVQERDGTNSPRVTTQTLSGALPTSPSGSGAKYRPAAVQSFKDDL